MHPVAQVLLGIVLLTSSFSILLVRKPVHASLCFLLTLMTLATLYLELSAEFIAVMQVLVYAGAILVIFMFVIVLFQDAHEELEHFKPKSSFFLLLLASLTFPFGLAWIARHTSSLPSYYQPLPPGFGSAGSLGRLLYTDFFFPFEAIIMMFLVAIVGSLYIAKKKGR